MYDVPHLRFPEFSGEWERKRLKDVCNIRTGNKNTQDKSDNGIYPFYVRSQIVERINSWTFDGEAILTAGDGVGVGKVFHYSTGKIGVHQRVYILSDFKCDGKYLYSYFAGNFYNRVKRMSAKNSVDSVRMEMIADMPIALPSIEEQKKIGHLLALLDDRIATQNKIIEDLKKLKSAISKHLFARKDLLETTICLSNIATLKNGYAFQSGKYNALGKWKILTITNVPGERYINDEDCNCIINLPNDIQDHQVLKEGDILISLTGNVGRVSLCKNGDYLLNQRVGLLQLSKNVNREFLYQILSSQRFENSMIACGQGAAQMNIGKGDVESYVLPYSSNGNNILWVAKILHSYDERIINELRRLTLLTMQKQYLLTQMFI
jgi:type I restriction enzyme S subunit